MNDNNAYDTENTSKINSNQESKTLLLNQQKKSGAVKNCINATRKGIYMFEFDNSYSLWRSKTLYYRVYYSK